MSAPCKAGPRAKTEPLREAIKLLDLAVKWAEGGGKVTAAELRAVRAAFVRATTPINPEEKKP